MEEKLKKLFELQEFAGNPDLHRIIEETRRRYTKRKLSLDDASAVSAAGDPALMRETHRKGGDPV